MAMVAGFPQSIEQKKEQKETQEKEKSNTNGTSSVNDSNNAQEMRRNEIDNAVGSRSRTKEKEEPNTTDEMCTAV